MGKLYVNAWVLHEVIKAWFCFFGFTVSKLPLNAIKERARLFINPAVTHLLLLPSFHKGLNDSR